MTHRSSPTSLARCARRRLGGLLLVPLALALAACGPADPADSSRADPAPQAATAAPPAAAAPATPDPDTRADVDDLPPYLPDGHLSGTIRSHGFGLGGVLEQWQKAFRVHHPDVVFENNLPTSDIAFPALVTGVSDLGPNGGEPAITEALSFFETRGYHASSVIVATGAFDIKSRSNGPVVFVHKDNPISQLSVDQLDGIFGAERLGGLRGFEWTPVLGRDAGQDLRTWGQLGLTGDWADKPIQTYGHAPSGTTRFFQLHVLGNTDKWNPNYRGYVETGSKMIAPEDKQQKLGIQHMLREELAHDRYGIAWTIMSQAEGVAGIKPIALAARGSQQYVAPSKATFQDRSYPLARNIYIYYDRKPGAPMDPKLKEFLRFVLSREAQQMVADGDYLPLPAKFAREQLAKLD